MLACADFVGQRSEFVKTGGLIRAKRLVAVLVWVMLFGGTLSNWQTAEVICRARQNMPTKCSAALW